MEAELDDRIGQAALDLLAEVSESEELVETITLVINQKLRVEIAIEYITVQ